MAKTKKGAIHNLATKYNLPLEKVEAIVTSQFKHVAKVMSSGKFESVRLPYFGKFSVKKGRVKYINREK
jgi:nucleoid DNA-binding protein|tara:strand:- start:660 stop:866 length:207 start_codon:yes stop_codon:yes gene_type:complete